MLRGAGLIAATALTALILAAPAGAAHLLPTSKDYGSQIVGTTSTWTFTLTPTRNICTDPGPEPSICDGSSAYVTETTALVAAPGGTAMSGDFVIHNIDCQYPAFVGPPATTWNPANTPPARCHFSVSFAPTTAGGARSLTLSFPDTGGPTATLNLTGVGVAPISPRKKCKRKHRAAAAKKCKKKKR
jgi:hypothetical protein